MPTTNNQNSGQHGAAGTSGAAADTGSQNQVGAQNSSTKQNTSGTARIHDLDLGDGHTKVDARPFSEYSSKDRLTSPPTACASTGLTYTSGAVIQDLYNALSSPVNGDNVEGRGHESRGSGGESQSTRIDYLMEDYSEEQRQAMQARVDHSQP